MANTNTNANTNANMNANNGLPPSPIPGTTFTNDEANDVMLQLRTPHLQLVESLIAVPTEQIPHIRQIVAHQGPVIQFVWQTITNLPHYGENMTIGDRELTIICNLAAQTPIIRAFMTGLTRLGIDILLLEVVGAAQPQAHAHM